MIRRALHRIAGRARATSFDSWLFALMLLFTSFAVAAGLYVSYTALRYVAEEIGGMPSAVASVFPLTIDASVAACLMGEWWLAGRRKREGLAFGYVFVIGLVFAGLTVGGNALHGALALSVQRPIELHIGGMLVPLPWWCPIAVSAVPGLAIACPSVALSMVVAAWRRDRGLGRAAAAEGVEAPRLLRPKRADGERPALAATPKPKAIAAPSPGKRLSKDEVLELVREARQALKGELGRAPTDAEIAARLTADGHTISASRVRWYLAQPESRDDGEPAGKEVVAWHGR